MLIYFVADCTHGVRLVTSATSPPLFAANCGKMWQMAHIVHIIPGARLRNQWPNYWQPIANTVWQVLQYLADCPQNVRWVTSTTSLLLFVAYCDTHTVTTVSLLVACKSSTIFCWGIVYDYCSNPPLFVAHWTHSVTHAVLLVCSHGVRLV